MTDAPLISVCMPVFNARRYVAEAIESILGQTFSDFEFLIIDDGSTDDSIAVLERYAKRDPRIRITSQTNQGVAATLNELIQQARGEFIARMDADDIALPERFEKQAGYLRAHPDCVMVGSRVWEMDAEGYAIGELYTLEGHEAIDAYHFQMRGPALLHPSIMMRRHDVLAVGGYRTFHIEDIDLYLRLAERGRLERTPEFLLRYRVHANNVSRTEAFFERGYRELSEILTEAYKRRNLPVKLPPPAVMQMDKDQRPPVERYRQIGWNTLALGHANSARKYASRVLARRPLSIDSWRLMYCALRGY